MFGIIALAKKKHIDLIHPGYGFLAENAEFARACRTAGITFVGPRPHAVFNGKIIVRKDAQKTDSKQTNKNLVLSDDAVVDTKPELQIFADDVRCTHGATIGQLDAEALF